MRYDHPGVSRNVQIISEAFFMPSLNRSRRIWLYLPGGYHAAKKRYPVLYMHDGQNLFDAATSFSGEWGVDETLDRVDNACIVVGIDNGGPLRLTEYNPNDHAQNGPGEGLQYLEFIVQTLKPFIDTNFRTLRTASFTYMAGSSMGGLISLYAGLYYPKIFGALGIFSPAFWIAPMVTRQMEQRLKPKSHGKQRYYFYGGGKENPGLLDDIRQVKGMIDRFTRAETVYSINPAGEHNESCWGREFLPFYRWISHPR